MRLIDLSAFDAEREEQLNSQRSTPGARVTASSELPLPEEIRQMRRLYEPGDASLPRKCRNFYLQGKFMENYEDIVVFDGAKPRYLPAYHDLTLRELRGYFTWRKEIRKGNYRVAGNTMAMIYLYELVNGIGTTSPEESLQKMREFEEHYINMGSGSEGLRANLRKWMLGVVVVNGLPPQEAWECLDEESRKHDEALLALLHPEDHSDEEVFRGLCFLGDPKLPQSSLLKKLGEEARPLFARVWRYAVEQSAQEEKDLFAYYFGKPQTYRWYPLGNALYYDRLAPEPRPCIVNDCRKYFNRRGVWYQTGYPLMYYDRKKLKGFLREVDRLLRKYLQFGHPLTPKLDYAWTWPYIEGAIEEDRQEKIEAARPKVTIHFDDLEKIRQDASVTRDSLLTEEELEESETPALPEEMPQPALPQGFVRPIGAEPDISLNPLHLQVLRALLARRPVEDMIAAEHGMPEVITDAVNEALFDEIGDTALECEGGSIRLVEDYREDVARLVGGME